MKRFCELKVGDKVFIRMSKKIYEKIVETLDFVDGILFLEVLNHLIVIENIYEDFAILENHICKVEISTSMDRLLLELEEC